jgi:formylglycine-generating enzyme required for sulfatase activity
MIRGGSWYCDAHICRSAIRRDSSADVRSDYFGFRIVFKKGKRK